MNQLVVNFYSRSYIYIFAIALFIVSVMSRLLFNGMLYRFDYHLFQPDGAIYTFMALKYSGFSHVDAAQEVISWYEKYGEPDTKLEFDFFDQDKNPGVWNFVATRVVYPLLSTPFVALIGIRGMLVVPILSYLVLLLIVTRIAILTKRPIIGLGILFLLTSSSTISRWYIANLTDGLLATFIALALLACIRLSGSALFGSLTILSLLGLFTRFSIPFWIALGLLFIFKNRWVSFVLFLTSALSAISILLARPDLSLLVSGTDGWIHKVVFFPLSGVKVLFIEFAQLAAMDRSLLAIILIAVYLSLRNYKVLSSQAFILLGLAGWFIGALNGVMGVNFRFQLPIVVFACWVILESFSWKESEKRILSFGISRDN